MTRTVACLEEAGLVTRRPHDTDGRQVVVELTDAARDVLADDRRRRDAWLAQRLGDLDPDELELLRRVAPLLRTARRRREVDVRRPPGPQLPALRHRLAACPTSARGCSASPRTGSSSRSPAAPARSGITTGLQFLPIAAVLAVRRRHRRPLPEAPHPRRDAGRRWA